MEDINKLIITQIKEMKDDIKEDLKGLIDSNSIQHNSIIARQDHTNGCIADAQLDIAKIKTSQIKLRFLLIGIAIALFVLGFMPDRLWSLIKLSF